MLVLARPTAPRSSTDLGHQQGSNPCGVLGLSSAACTNVSGGTWSASHFWDSNTWNIACPPAFPYTAQSVSTQTSSRHYTQTVGTSGTGTGNTQVVVIDDNVRGHPISYTPTAACTVAPPS